jgi:hypothetical protein
MVPDIENQYPIIQVVVKSTVKKKYDSFLVFCIVAMIVFIICGIMLALLGTLPFFINALNPANTNNHNQTMITHLYNNTVYNHSKVSGFYTINHKNPNYSLITFKGNGFIQFQQTMQCSVLIVGGGGGASWGGGGFSGGSGTGGGGGGGVGEGILTFLADEQYVITVGMGGGFGRNSIGYNGGNSMIVGKNIHEIAFGGGYGGYYIYDNNNGGSSGGNYGYNGSILIRHYLYILANGRSSKATRGEGTLTYYGNPGGMYISNTNNVHLGGGGGGGAGNIGISTDNYSGGAGGIGYFWTITQEYYGGGGGGGGGNNSGHGDHGGPGGFGGGGNGGGSGTNASPALPNSGGGGGGAMSSDSLFSTSGGSGIVIIAIPVEKTLPKSSASEACIGLSSSVRSAPCPNSSGDIRPMSSASGGHSSSVDVHSTSTLPPSELVMQRLQGTVAP